MSAIKCDWEGLISSKLEDLPKQQGVGLKIVLAQEEERRRIAREIHDGPAQDMANIVLCAEYCEQLLTHDPGKLQEELEKLKDLVRVSLKDIRQILFDLRPMPLDDLGLVGGLRRFCEDFQEQHNLPLNFFLFGKERRYSKALELAAFRIIQEALNNVHKHAEASEVTVKLELYPHRITALIRDDGKGFDLKNSLDKRGHYGLLNMRERAQALSGEIQIHSALERGTEIFLVIPVCVEGRTRGENTSTHCR